jgi:hypothetical protein
MPTAAEERAQKAWDDLLATFPRHRDITIAMVANSTNTGQYTDVDTDIASGQAWMIYGFSYLFEYIDQEGTAAPLAGIDQAEYTWALQLHRGDDHTELIGAFDEDTLIHDGVSRNEASGAAAESVSDVLTWPRRVRERNITMRQKIRLIFDTATDITKISDPTIHLSCRLFYDVVMAPTAGQTKLGHIAKI